MSARSIIVHEEPDQPPPSRRQLIAKRRLSLSSRLAVLVLGIAFTGSLLQLGRARASRRRALQAQLLEARANSIKAQEKALALRRELPETPISVDPNQEAPSAPLESREPEPVSVCPGDMLLVDGEYCPSVAHICRTFLSQPRDRCAEYREGSRCFGQPVHKRFCIDRYEYPNLEGVLPLLALNWAEATTLCKLSDKRLCTDSEWTLACEGPARLPYPYGYARDTDACNIDKPYIIPEPDAYANPRTKAAEIARLDQREPSGTRTGCVSAYGVYDLTGNVDEWVFNESGFSHKTPYESGLKGGYWGPVRNRCRPMTTDHNAWHEGYQIGFRCCTEAAGSKFAETLARKQ